MTTFQSLEHPIRWLFLAHALAGAIAVFAVPLAARKGGKLHVALGKAYVAAMVFVGISAFVLTPWSGGSALRSRSRTSA